MTVGLSYLGDTSRVRITISDRPNGAVSVERSTNQLFWQFVRGGLAVPLLGGAATLDDWEFADSVQNFYRITQVALEDAVDVFTASGTWNKPPGLTAARITVVGGGGGGGGSQATGVGQASVGNGGAPGVIAVSVIDAVTLGASEIVTVPAGGAGNLGAAGSASGVASFGAHVSANGGGGGALFSASNVNESGSGTVAPTTGTGQVVFSGAPGGGALKFITLGNGGLRGGDGGSGPFGSGGRGGTNLGNGFAASGFGSGGGGATSTPSSGARTGGAGSGGLVIVEHIFAD